MMVKDASWAVAGRGCADARRQLALPRLYSQQIITSSMDGWICSELRMTDQLRRSRSIEEVLANPTLRSYGEQQTRWLAGVSGIRPYLRMTGLSYSFPFITRRQIVFKSQEGVFRYTRSKGRL